MASATSQQIAELPDGGILYEPRALWDIKAFELLDVPQLLPMNREHFCNTEPYPMQVERIALAPINYAFRSTPAGAKFQSVSAVLSACKLLVSSPFRYHLGLTPVFAGALCPGATGEPADPKLYPSGSYGLTALNFERRTLQGKVKGMILPRYGSISWDLSAANRYVSAVPLDVDATMLWEESGGLWPGSARSFGPIPLQELGTLGNFPSGQVPPNPEEGWPYRIDAFAPPAQAGSLDFWQPQTSFTPAKFLQQEATRQGSTVINGMRVHLDQKDMDDAIHIVAAGGLIAPASMRVGCRVQTVGGGSNRDWWRPGAPLCLVLDTITPAVVYELEKPFTLGPGDTLDVMLELPGVSGLGDVEPFAKMFQLGVSFNGWAQIGG